MESHDSSRALSRRAPTKCRSRMARQAFSIGENCRIDGEAPSGVATDPLIVCPAYEIERTKSRIAPRQAAGRKNVIATGDVIAENH